MKVTPSFIVSFETQLFGIGEDTWTRRLANLHWDKFMKSRDSQSKREIIVWLLENAKIYNEGNGGNNRQDNIIAATFELENDNFGNGLELTRNELEDNVMAGTASGTSVATLDYAATWMRATAGAAAYFPQEALFKLIENGTTKLGYDGLPFFSAAHPVNPNGSVQTYSNIITGVDINPTPGALGELDALGLAQRNFAKALAAVRSIRGIDNKPRHLVPKTLLVPNALSYRANQLATAGFLTQSDNNVFGKQNIEAITEPLLDTEPTVYYIGVEDMMADQLGPFMWSNREPFSMRSYSLFDDAFLNRSDTFEWTMKGRNAAVYGHPYLFFRCTV
jgi:phage major head subunit gpT-like protein